MNSHDGSFKRNKRVNACKIIVLQALIFKLRVQLQRYLVTLNYFLFIDGSQNTLLSSIVPPRILHALNKTRSVKTVQAQGETPIMSML